MFHSLFFYYDVESCLVADMMADQLAAASHLKTQLTISYRTTSSKPVFRIRIRPDPKLFGLKDLTVMNNFRSLTLFQSVLIFSFFSECFHLKSNAMSREKTNTREEHKTATSEQKTSMGEDQKTSMEEEQETAVGEDQKTTMEEQETTVGRRSEDH